MEDHRDPPSLEGDDLDSWSALATVLVWLPPALDSQLLRDAELTHFEYGILYALAAAPDRTLRMSVLADYANSSLSRLSRATSRLEARDCVRRAPAPDDGRATLAALTDRGLETFDRATPGHVRTIRRLVLDALTPSQTRQLGEISRRITRAIRDDVGWRPAPGSAG